VLHVFRYPDAPDFRAYLPRGRVAFVLADPELAGHRSIDATSIGGGTVSRAQASSRLTRLALRIDPYSAPKPDGCVTAIHAPPPNTATCSAVEMQCAEENGWG
jgi:hypothetical protein